MAERPTAAPAPGRRQFLTQTAGVACSAALFGAGLGLFARQSRANPATALRPPGALADERFLSACVRCGLCVRGCPYDTLKLSEMGDAVPTGTPYFEARKIPCEMCTEIPCVKACPTGALDPQLKDIDRARMGLAQVVDQETCLNYLGLRCDVCYRVCPAIDKAITLERRHNPRSDRHSLFIPTIHSEACTGCGKCEHACVLEVAAIKVLPLALAKGGLGKHYRLGWEEKRKAGGSLIEPQVQMPVRRPEGVDIRGVPETPPAATPDALREGLGGGGAR